MSRPLVSRRSSSHSRASRCQHVELRRSCGSAVVSTSGHGPHVGHVTAVPHVVPIVIRNIAGEELLVLDAPACENLLYVKKLISEKCAISTFAQRLVSVDAVDFPDGVSLVELPSPVELTVCFMPTSSEVGSELLLPARSGDVVIAEKVLRRLANPNVVFEDGVTPLFVAAKAGHLAVVQAAADTNLTHRNDGSTPLNYAVRKGNFKVAQLLCASRADVNKAKKHTGVTPLHAAVSKGNLEMVQLLCENGAAVDCSSSQERGSGTTPLYEAASEGNVDIATLLCSSGADMDKERMVVGDTPLFVASQEGHRNVVQLLIKGRADMHKATKDGRTPLYAAAHGGHVDVVLQLCRNGADREKARQTGETPIGAAKRMGHRRVFEELLHLL